MRLRTLLLLLPLAGCTDDGMPSGDCYSHLETDAQITMPADPPLNFRIESCKLDVDACGDLCTMELQRLNVAGQETHCDVKFSGDSVSLNIFYDQFNDQLDCPIADQGSALF